MKKRKILGIIFSIIVALIVITGIVLACLTTVIVEHREFDYKTEEAKEYTMVLDEETNEYNITIVYEEVFQEESQKIKMLKYCDFKVKKDNIITIYSDEVTKKELHIHVDYDINVYGVGKKTEKFELVFPLNQE